jgi:hypothetical protein
MIGRLVAGGLMMITIGCAPAPPAGEEAESYPVQGSSGRLCDAAKAQSLVGRARSATLGAEALRLSGAGTLRWLRPGEIVTMEYREDRLNIELDAKGRVKAIRCG